MVNKMNIAIYNFLRFWLITNYSMNYSIFDFFATLLYALILF